MSGLLESVGIHSAFSVSCGEGFGEIDITQIEPEEIRQWLESQMSMFDEDSQFLTGDDNVDYYVKYYSQRRDGQYGRYNYEYALENWDNLTYTQKKALYHIYEYSVRQCEKDLDGTSATYKNCKDRVDRMSQYLFTYYPAAASMYVGGEDLAYFNETSICKDMAEIAGKKEFSHSFQMFDDIINCDIGQLLIYYEDGQVVYDTTRGIATTEPDVINLSFEGYKAGMRLVLNYSFASPEMEGCCGSQEVSYYVPQARAHAYVKNEAKKNPGVYDHQEELGLSQSALSIFLMCSRSSEDMDVLDNMTKSHGQSYTEIFTADPSKISSSGATAIVMYNNYLSQRYYQFGDETCRQEAARMNDFLMRGEEQYSQEYSNIYNTALYYMCNPDAAPASKASILESFGRGMESEIAVWPTALYTLAVNSDKDNVNYYGFAAMKGIGPIENNMDSYSATKMRDGEIKDYSIQQRLSYYQYMADNGESLTTAEQNDLRDIYYSYLEYVQHQRINLYVTQSDEDRFNELALLMKSLDSNYAGLEFWNDQNSKIAKAGADHPVAFSVGKIAGDTVIYLAWDVATGGFGAAAGIGVESFAGKVFTATVADVIIKDLPRSLLSYANGEDMGDIALDFAKEVAFDVAGNAAGEVIGNTLGNAISTKKGKELVKQFDEAIDQNAFLKNLAPGDVGLMVAQMDYKKAADVLGNFSDDTVKSIIGGLPEYSAKSIAGNMMANADDVTKAAIIKSLKPADAFDAFSGLANESKAAVLGNLDRSTADALSKSYYETVSNFGDMNDAVKIISQRTDITDDQKIDELHKLFDNSPYKTDVNIPSDVQYVKEFTKDGVVYDWPELYGFNESTIRSITREDGLPDVWDRYGYMGGSNFADMPSAGRYTYGERAIPYLENEAAYHCGTFNNKSYFDKIDAIRKGDIDSLNGILKSEGIPELSPNQFDEMVSSYRKGIVDIKANIKNYSGNVDVTYGLKGNANKWGDMPGGAGQYITPFNGNDLKKLGILQETNIKNLDTVAGADGLMYLKDTVAHAEALNTTIKNMNNGSVRDALKLFKECETADIVKVIENVDVKKAALMVDSLPKAEADKVINNLSSKCKKDIIDELGDIKMQQLFVQESGRDAIENMTSWREIIASHGISEAQIEEIVKKPMSQRSKEEVQTILDIYRTINDEADRSFFSKVTKEEDAVSMLTNSSQYRDGTIGFVSRLQDCKGVKTSDDYIRIFGLNYIDKNTGKTPYLHKNSVQVVRFEAESASDAFIPFGGNNDWDREFVSRFLSDEEIKNFQQWPMPFDGGGVTIQSDLHRPGHTLAAPGAPELNFESGVKFQRAYMYNIDKEGNEVLLGWFDKKLTGGDWVPTAYGIEFIENH
ncbi:MAG: hypothetical protein K5900_12750 [Butyrivibrio sp.]|nr:hypothetical protein [Butyrivibrio sp.]